MGGRGKCSTHTVIGIIISGPVGGYEFVLHQHRMIGHISISEPVRDLQA